MGDFPFHRMKGFTWVHGLVLVSPQMLVFLPLSPGEVTSSLVCVAALAGRRELLLPALGASGAPGHVRQKLRSLVRAVLALS